MSEAPVMDVYCLFRLLPRWHDYPGSYGLSYPAMATPTVSLDHSLLATYSELLVSFKIISL